MSGKKRLLLIGWDSADWKLMHPLLDAGELPGVQHLVEGGVSGNLTTLEPQLSPMLWTSIATGKMAYHHGIHGFTEVDPVSGRIVPVSAATRRCKTIWEMLDERGLRSHVIGWFATQGERDLKGKVVSNLYPHLHGCQSGQSPADWPPPPSGTYWPGELGAELNHLRVSPREITGDIIRAFVPDAAQVDQKSDRRLHLLAGKLAEAYSVQSAATYLMETDPEWDFMAVYFRALDEICHLFMPYHPPRMEGIPEADFATYKNVVTATYRAHDMMLQRLIHLAGPETAIMLVSDHGFHSDHLRPKFTPRVPAGITVWHRAQGVFAAHGPGFKQDELVHGARLLDLAPTILHYFDLPPGEDMEGRVLAEAFAERRPVQTIPTWEHPGGVGKRRGTLSSEESRALLEQFVALGYIEEVSPDPGTAAAETRRENRWNLARAWLYAGKEEMALPLLEECHAECPDRPDYSQLLARTQLHLGLIDEAERTLAVCLGSFGQSESAHLLMGAIETERGNHDKALGHLATIAAKEPDNVRMLQSLSDAYLALRHWDRARDAARKLLAVDTGSAHAHLVLARCALHRGECGEAADEAIAAIGLQYGNPRGHLLLGVALARLGDWPAAEAALTKHLRLASGSAVGSRMLARVLRALGKIEAAAECSLLARVLQSEYAARRAERLASLRRDIARREAVRGESPGAARAGSAAMPPGGSPPEVDLPEFTVVSGLPRSGTSLMMQILRAGGMEVMHDGLREADDDNPEGYWEWEEIKALRKNPRVIEQAAGKAVKVISALLPHLPPRHRYRVLFMRRPVSEVVDSQWKMLEHRGSRPKAERTHLIATQEAHVAQVLASLRSSPRVRLLEVDFPALVKNPLPQLAEIRAFLGKSMPTGPEALAAAVKPELYRNRDKATS